MDPLQKSAIHIQSNTLLILVIQSCKRGAKYLQFCFYRFLAFSALPPNAFPALLVNLVVSLTSPEASPDVTFISNAAMVFIRPLTVFFHSFRPFFDFPPFVCPFPSCSLSQQSPNFCFPLKFASNSGNIQ